MGCMRKPPNGKRELDPSVGSGDVGSIGGYVDAYTRIRLRCSVHKIQSKVTYGAVGAWVEPKLQCKILCAINTGRASEPQSTIIGKIETNRILGIVEGGCGVAEIVLRPTVVREGV